MSTDRPIPYRKFMGSRSGLVSMSQLWAGDDHLLLVTSTFAVERYRRFYFRDIEALIIRPTTTQRTWIIADAIALAIFGGITALLVSRHKQGDSDAAIFYGVLAGIFLVALLYQLVRGPSCATFLQVRSGQERIAAANRVRASVKMRDRLAVLIAAAAEAAAAAPFLP